MRVTIATLDQTNPGALLDENIVGGLLFGVGAILSGGCPAST
jgi:uncharacterized membrane protein YedE/YeeE